MPGVRPLLKYFRMPETCKAKYRWTREQLTIAMRHHQATKLRRGVVLMMKIFSIILLSIIAVVLLAWLLLPSTSAPPWALLLLVIFCFYLLMFDRVNAWSWGRRFGKRPDAGMEVEWEFSKKEIKTQSTLGEATFQWKGFLRVVEASDGFLFYPLEKLFHWMPFSAFESAECVDILRAFVIENNVPLIQLRSNKGMQTDGAIAWFSSNFFPSALNPDRAPQLKPHWSTYKGQRRFKKSKRIKLNPLEPFLGRSDHSEKSQSEIRGEAK